MTISITAIESISAMGTSAYLREAYASPAHCLSADKSSGTTTWVGKLHEYAEVEIQHLLETDPEYGKLDRSVLYAIWTSRRAIARARWGVGSSFGVNIGSSRGATALFEEYYEEYLRTSMTGSLTSPTTTLGNISSWVAHDLNNQGPELSHSITCSTSLHALLNGVAWLEAGLASKFLVGGSEAPLTPFTIAQMRALRIYSRNTENYPCRALDLDKSNNSMVLGEGAAVACLEKDSVANALAIIDGMGFATEILEHPISLSASGMCLQKSMEMACCDTDKNEIDVIVMHAPGTIKGDQAEYNAIKTVFGNRLPVLTSNKWKIGHCLGPSGMLSLEMAVLMLQQQKFIEVPYFNSQENPKKINRILVNAVGFGGNAVSILLTRP